MSMHVDTTGTVAVVAPEGRLDAIAAPALRRAVEDAIGQGRARVVVDLAAVSFVDSSGLGALIGALKSARTAGGDLRIASAGEQVRTVLRLTNLDRVLRNHDAVETAFDGD